MPGWKTILESIDERQATMQSMKSVFKHIDDTYKSKVSISATIDVDLYVWIKKLASESDRSMSELINSALREKFGSKR